MKGRGKKIAEGWAFLISGELSGGGGWGGGGGGGGRRGRGGTIFQDPFYIFKSSIQKNQKLLLLGLISILGGQESFISSILPVSSPLRGGKMR